MNNFSDLWKSGLEDDARRLGVNDRDVSVVRRKVKALLVSAGWANEEGELLFVSDFDAANALQAVKAEVNKVSARLVQANAVNEIRAGATPTKSQVLSGSVATLLPAGGNFISSAFAPKMGSLGDKCPRCSGEMVAVALTNGKAALYCTADRVVTPLEE